MTDSVKQYADRDAIALDQAGGHYCRHVQAMTAEGLHEKSDIAAELAWRDAEIERLCNRLDELVEDNKKAWDENGRLRVLLRDIREWITSPEICTWPYVEGSGLYDDTRDYSARIDAALGEKK